MPMWTLALMKTEFGWDLHSGFSAWNSEHMAARHRFDLDPVAWRGVACVLAPMTQAFRLQVR